MLTLNVLRQSAPYLIEAVNVLLSNHSVVTDWLVQKGSGSNTNIMIIWFKNKHFGSLIAYQIFIGEGGDFFTPNDELYPLVKVWLNEVISKIRQQTRVNMIKIELLQRTTNTSFDTPLVTI